jgi:DNA-binding NarL/FixJ family response regulator
MLQTVTVKLHLRGIFKKLECETRMKTVLKARAEGLVD